MTSILTNIAAMSALQTLRQLGQDMEKSQAHVSSGLRVGSASDNAAYWSIATTMRSDNGALSAVQDALGLGAAKVDTAYAAMESSIDVVQEIKNKLVAASEPGVDKSKVQEEITQLQDQLRSIASSASFSGENWLQAKIGGTTDASGVVYAKTDITKQIVGSFTRDSNGNVAVKSVNVVLDEKNVLFDLSGGDAGILDGNVMKGFRQVKDTNGADVYAKVNTNGLTPTTTDFQWKDIGGDVYAKADTNGNLLTASNADYLLKVGGAFVDATDAKGTIDPAATNASIVYSASVSVSELDISKLDDYRTSTSTKNLGIGNGTYASDEAIIETLIAFVDGQLEKMTSAAAKLGSVSMRIGMQEDFISKLSDSIDSGVGRLVDAEMNEESTKLKALQTQQQLAVQSLSIANSDGQNILSLFR